MFTYGCCTLDKMEEAVLTLSSEQVVERLLSVSKAKNLKNSDIVSLTGWSASKVSKITKNNQKLSSDDLKTWAKALGYPPVVFLGDVKDLRNYNLADDVRGIRDILTDAVTRKGSKEDVDLISDAVRFESALAIVNTLQVEPTDYVIKGEIERVPDLFDRDDKDYSDNGILITFFHRSIELADSIICILYIISPDREKVILGLFEVSTTGNPFPQALRMQDKSLLNLDENGSGDFDKYYRSNQKWLKGNLHTGEIYTVIYDSNNLPEEANLEEDLARAYDLYCDLVYAKTKGVDIKGRKETASKNRESREAEAIQNKAEEIKNIIVSDLVERGNGIKLIKQIDDPDVSRLVRSTGIGGLILQVSDCEADYWKFRVVNLQGFSHFGSKNDNERQRNYPAEAVHLLSRVSEVFLEDIWYPEKMKACKYSFVFYDHKYYEAFNELIKDKKFNNWFSNILIDIDTRHVVEEHVYDRKDGQKEKSPLDYPIISDNADEDDTYDYRDDE